MKTLADYIGAFSRLHTDRSPARWSEATRYQAPHKPLLLLSVIDLFAEGTIKSNLIELTPELGQLFTLYWSKVMPPDRRGNIALPLFFLRSDGFWTLIPRTGKEALLAATRHIRSVNQLREIVLGAELDNELSVLLGVEESRNLLRTVLIEKYFAPELHAVLIEQGLVNIEAFQYSQRLLEEARKEGRVREVAGQDEYRPAARDQGFRRAVVTAYNHRCAFCGVRVLTADGHTAVDAAHIVPWSLTRDDRPQNGMALCQLCHWTFDEGLITVSQKYIVIISRQLSTNNNIPGHLPTLAGRIIIGPDEQILWPDLMSLSRHHADFFRKP